MDKSAERCVYLLGVMPKINLQAYVFIYWFSLTGNAQMYLQKDVFIYYLSKAVDTI